MVCPLSSPLGEPKHTAFKLPPGNCVHAAFSPRTLIMANHHCISSCSLLANCALEWPAIWWGKLPAMSTFSPISSVLKWYENAYVCVCVCVCVDRMNLKYALHWYIHISVHSILYQCYTQAHKHILRPFEDSEPMGRKVDSAKLPVSYVPCPKATCRQPDRHTVIHTFACHEKDTNPFW